MEPRGVRLLVPEVNFTVAGNAVTTFVAGGKRCGIWLRNHDDTAYSVWILVRKTGSTAPVAGEITNTTVPFKMLPGEEREFLLEESCTFYMKSSSAGASTASMTRQEFNV